MKLYVCIIESYTDLRTIVSAVVLAVLLLACAGMAAGETWVVDDDGGGNFTSIQAAVENIQLYSVMVSKALSGFYLPKNVCKDQISTIRLE